MAAIPQQVVQLSMGPSQETSLHLKLPTTSPLFLRARTKSSQVVLAGMRTAVLEAIITLKMALPSNT